jgi:hypothetical protein
MKNIKDIYYLGEPLTTKQILWFLFLIILCIFFINIGISKNIISLLSLTNFLTPDLTNYPYQNPPIFFSIGEALSSIAILFAIYQFRKEKWFIALNVRDYIQPVVFLSLLIGVLLAMTSSLIIIKKPVNIFQTSVFWQIIASIAFIFSIIFLFVMATNKKLYNSRNAEKFYEIMGRELSRANPDRINVILNALLENLDRICMIASQHIDAKGAQFSINILDVILGEASLVDLITTKRLDALRYIIAMIEKYKLNERRVRGFSRIIKNLFSDKNSYLYKHLEKDGFALSTNLYESLFGSPIILSNFNLFGWPSLDYKMQSGLKTIQTEVFIEALSQAIESYLKNGLIPPRHINEGISHLSSIFGNLCLKIAEEEKRGVDTKHVLEEEWWSLHIIVKFLGHDYAFLAYQEELNQEVEEKEKTVAEASFYSDETINAGIAAAIYKAFEQLSYIENDTYHMVLELLHGMMYEYEYKKGYRKPFEKRMWEQIATNVVRRHYPAVLRPYLEFIGFCAASDENQRQGWIGEQAERMRKLLYIDLKPLLDADTKMINDEKMKDALLPKFMAYEDGVFTYTFGFGKGDKKVIPPPPEGSMSTIDGINLDHQSLL